MSNSIKFICYGCDEPIWQDEKDCKVRVGKRFQRFHNGCAQVYVATAELDAALKSQEMNGVEHEPQTD